MRKIMLLVSMCLLVLAGSAEAQRAGGPADGSGPKLIIETAKGVIEIQLFQADAPKTVEQIVGLAKRNFYRAQRFHRVERTLVQFGDPASRDMTRREWWGRSGSGNPIGVAEFSKRTHARGVVSMAHPGNAINADSQMFILKTAVPSYDGKHVIIGRVTRGMDVVDQLAVGDQLKQVRVE
jgi:cyclophilin family peptidyl-prolyl cis-trans isomerase